MKVRTRRMRAMKTHNRSSIGPRCKEVFYGCITCACWHHYDTHGFFPRSYEDAAAYNDVLAFESNIRSAAGGDPYGLR